MGCSGRPSADIAVTGQGEWRISNGSSEGGEDAALGEPSGIAPNGGDKVEEGFLITFEALDE